MTLDQRGGRISDPVHGYVHFTWIEREILNQRIAQRLRYISQNGLAHLVFPEVRTSRFTHSLGAMHLSSEFLAACFRNSNMEVRKELGEAIKKAVHKIAGDISDPEDAVRSFPAEALKAVNYCNHEFRPYVLLAEQALRLAALFHDLGHLPYSHDFENSIEDFWLELPNDDKERSPFRKVVEQGRGQMKIRERIGHELAWILLRALFSDLKSEPNGEAIRLSFQFARNILEESVLTPNVDATDAVFQWLHTLIDGELDVDRCDYILRDGRNHGFEFAAYDLARLIDNLIVGRKDGSFVLAIKPQGLSAVETFLVSRFRSYQYGIRHHKVAQVGAALRYSISRILADTLNAQNKKLTKFAEDLSQTVDASAVSLTKAKGAELLHAFADYDDIWWTELMRERSRSDPDEWLQLVCWRKAGPKSLWKRTGEFAGELKKWNQNLPKSSDLEAQLQWSEAVSDLKKPGVLVVRHHFSPWIADPVSRHSLLSVQQNHDKLEPVSKLSPLVYSLVDAWMSDIQVQAFCKSDVNISKEKVIERLTISGGV